MTNVNGRGDNDEPILWGVSHLDGVTPVQVKFTVSPRSMRVDPITAIAFNPSVNAGVVPSNVKFAKATSSSDNTTIKPWVVHATTGAVLVDT